MDFVSFFYKYGFESLYKPIEGSALLLYIPAFFYVAIITAFILNKVVFKENSKQIVIISALIVLGLLMFLESAIFYSSIFSKMFPSIVARAQGVLRSHINLIPFVNLLAGFVCFASINNLKNIKTKIWLYAVIIVVSLFIDLKLFVPMTNYKLSHFNNSNLVHVNFSRDIWHLLPWFNILPLLLLFSYSFISVLNKNIRHLIYPTFIILAMFIPLINISAYNELCLQQGGRFMLIRNPYRWDSYLKRKGDIDKIINRYDVNYRTLYAGKGRLFPNSGRDWKLIAETETHTQEKEKVLFSYREFDHPYTGMMRGTFGKQKGWYGTNIWPPLSKDIADNIDNIKLMGVKWIISADEEIKSPSLIYRGECKSELGPLGKLGLEPDEGGTIYIYELANPKGIVFMVDNYEKVSQIDSLKSIFESKEHPWNKNTVYLETNPVNKHELSNKDLGFTFSNLESEAKIKRETFNSIEVNITTPKEKYLIMTYIYRPNWKAYINSSELKMYRAYGGFMCVKVPPGRYDMMFRYRPLDVYLGFILTAFGLLIPFVIIRIF